jgi:hypothetical protein
MTWEARNTRGTSTCKYHYAREVEIVEGEHLINEIMDKLYIK